MLERVLGQELQPMGRAHTAARERARKEEQRRALDWLQHPTFLQSSVSGVGGQVRREGVKRSMGKRGGGLWDRWFSVCFSLYNYILTHKNDSNFFRRQDCMPLMAISKWFTFSTHKIFILFLPMSYLQEVREWLGGYVASSQDQPNLLFLWAARPLKLYLGILCENYGEESACKTER